MLHQVQTLSHLGEFLRILGEFLRPLSMKIAPPFPDSVAEMFVHPIRNQEFRVFRPAVEFLGQPDFFFTQRFAVRGVGVLFVWRPVANMAVDNNQGRAICGLLERLKRPGQHLQIIGVGHTRDVPSISHKTRRHIFAE